MALLRGRLPFLRPLASAAAATQAGASAKQSPRSARQGKLRASPSLRDKRHAHERSLRVGACEQGLSVRARELVRPTQIKTQTRALWLTRHWLTDLFPAGGVEALRARLAEEDLTVQDFVRGGGAGGGDYALKVSTQPRARRGVAHTRAQRDTLAQAPAGRSARLLLRHPGRVRRLRLGCPARTPDA